jgi:hypothetical protein
MVCQLANHTDSPDRFVSIFDHWQDIVRRLDGWVSVYRIMGHDDDEYGVFLWD